MDENTEGTVKKALINKALVKKNKLIFFALNLVCVLPYIVRHYSHLGAGIAAGILLWMFILTVVQSDVDTPVSRNLPVLGCFDVFILLGLSFQELRIRFAPGGLSLFLGHVGDRRCSLLLLAGLVLCVLPFKAALAVWLKGLGRTAVGASVLLFFWSDGQLPEPTFMDGAKAFFAFYLLCAVVWYAMCVTSYTVDQGVLRRNNRLSWLLLGVFCTLCLAETSLVQEMIAPVQEWLLAVPGASLAWWKAVLAAVVLTGCAIAAYDYDYEYMGADSLMLGSLGGGVLLLRVLLSNYFAFSWLVFLTFLVGVFLCLQNEMQQETTLRLSSPAYLVAQTAALLLAVYLLKRGLWILTVLLGIYGLVFYTTFFGKMETPRRQLFRWLVTLSCPAALALGYIWQTRFVPEACLLLAVIYGVLALAIILLLHPHPGGRTSPEGYQMVVCALMVLLCLMTATRYGAKAHITFLPENGTVHIELEARGRDNEIALAVYQWNDLAGKPLSNEARLTAGETEIPIKGEQLTIVVTDTHGARTTVTDWYPGWMLETKK